MAIFMETGSATTMRSAMAPSVLTHSICPPMGLAEPGPVTKVVTPAARASAKQRSCGLRASSARRWGVMGSVHSLPSSPSKPRESPNTPR